MGKATLSISASSLTLSMPGFQKLAQAVGGRNPPPLTPLPFIRTKLNWCEQIQSYDKSLCEISSVLVNK